METIKYIFAHMQATDDAFKFVDSALRRQKRVNTTMALGLIAACSYIYVDLKYSYEQAKKIKALEEEVEKLKKADVS